MKQVNEKQPKLSRAVARKVLSVVDKGLSSGLGNPVPGEMCVEAAVCFALGQDHGDNPKCVGHAVREFKIQLNDTAWSSKKARAKGMRRVAIAQLGSDTIDQKEFAREVTIGVIKQILPGTLRIVAKLVPAHAEALEVAALACEAVINIATAKTASAAASAAAYAASAAASAAARAAANAAAYAASAAASDAASAAAYAARAAASAAARDAASAAAYAARDAASAAAYAASAAASAAAYAARDAASAAILTKAAEIGVQALKKLKAQGVKWLDLCKLAA